MLFAPNMSIEYFIAAGIVLLFGMGWHEYAHAVMADWWGDPTPRKMGRLTPNPLVHISWLGWLMFVVLGFGLLGSVPVNPTLMRDSRWGSFWTSFAGPLSNLIQGIVYAFIGYLVINIGGVTPFNFVGHFIHTLIHAGVFLNILLFFFSLLPLVIPAGIFSPMPMPFDGWTMIYSLLPGQFISYKSIPVAIKNNVYPLARFLYQPAYVWRDSIKWMSYATIVIIVLSFVMPPALNPLTYLMALPAYRLSAFLGY